MLKSAGKWFKVYQDEIGLFLWCALLLFLIRSSDVLFNNFAETAFLKRFGVEYLPIVYMLNSILTFIVMGFLAGVMARIPGSRLLIYILVFCGTTVAGLRFVIPMGIDLLYPLLFILKAQYEVILGLMFWNMANDLFNTRQSKRLFPLITAGGVLGGIIGSFGTPFLAGIIHMDNLLLVYLGTTVLGAVAVKRMDVVFPTLIVSGEKGKRVKGRPKMVEEVKKVLPMIKESRLVRILVMLTLMPNIVIPILNYQFNFAIDHAFVTEGKMITFFGYFRGVLNIISLIILLFVGRIYGRWGLPVALMFHPFNYLLAFVAFFLKFDVFSAVYARISTNVLRTTINNPARAVLVGLVPESYRSVVRPFLRGTVVRVGILMGSGLILLSERFVHPKYLSLPAALFVLLWIAWTLILKRGYSKILLDLISRNMLDLKSMEADDITNIFGDKNVQSQLVQAFLSSKGEECLWYGRLLKSLGVEGLDTHILSVMRNQDDRTRIGLVPLLSADPGDGAVALFKEIADSEKPDLTLAILRKAASFPPNKIADFALEVLETHQDPKAKAYALACLYRNDPGHYADVIDSWLSSEDSDTREAGVIAAGASGDGGFSERLKGILEKERDISKIPLFLEALYSLGAPDTGKLAYEYLNHPLDSIRLAALEAFDIHDDESLKAVVRLMGDSSGAVRGRAQQKVEKAPYNNPQVLIEALSIPSRHMRESIFEILESLKVKDLDVFRFARTQLEGSYNNLAETEAVKQLPEVPEKMLLADHLIQKREAQVENVLRVLSLNDPSGQMRTIWRGLSSADSRTRANSVEALEDIVEPSLGKILMPLLEDLPVSEALAVGKSRLQVMEYSRGSNDIYKRLLGADDWVTRMLTLNLLSKVPSEWDDVGIIETLKDDENEHVSLMARRLIELRGLEKAEREEYMAEEITIADKIMRLRGITLFERLSVSELAAVSSITEEVVYPAGEAVIKEGDPGETMYLIIHGEVSVVKGRGEGAEMELGRIGTGDYFGEMALFEGDLRSATIRTVKDSRMLVLHKREFSEIVREYPEIALHICKILSERIRGLHKKIEAKDPMVMGYSCKLPEA